MKILLEKPTCNPLDGVKQTKSTKEHKEGSCHRQKDDCPSDARHCPPYYNLLKKQKVTSESE